MTERVDIQDDLEGIGERVRLERVQAGLSQRELARRLGVSPSLISQIESGQSKPSVGTLYGIVTEFGVSLDKVIRGEEFNGAAENGTPPDPSAVVRHIGDRRVVDLDSGVRWEQLGPADGDVDFLLATYEVGGSSTPDESLMRHHGYEYAYIMSGTLCIQIGFRDHVLGPGDSIAFDSSRPHRLYNVGDVPVRAVWFVLGGGGPLG